MAGGITAAPRRWSHRVSPPYSRQEILHFLHSDVPGGVQRVLHAAVGRVDGTGREGGRVLLGGPWGSHGDGRAWGQPQNGVQQGTRRAWRGRDGHSRSLSVGLRGTWVPLACGSFGVELLLEGSAGRSYSRSRGRGVGVQSPPRPRGASHLRQVSCSRVTSSRHSGSVTFLALSEKRSNSDGEIR